MSISNSKNFLFILGAPRSGTTWIQRLVSSHPEVVSVDFETTLFYKYIKPCMETFNRETITNTKGIKHGMPAKYSELTFKNNLSKIIDKYYEDIIENEPECKLIVDKHPNNVFAINEIIQFINNPVFLHTVRDGRDVVASSLTTNRNHGFGATDYEKGIIKWRKSVDAFENEKARMIFLEVKYEDIFLAQKEFTIELLTKCGLNSSDDIVEKLIDENQWQNTKFSFANSEVKSRSQTNSYYKNYFNNYQIWLMNIHAKETLKRYNYLPDEFNILEKNYFPIHYFFKRTYRIIKKKIRK